jgi:hypothetical protein
VPSAGPAIGLDASGVDGVSVPQLQTPQQLPQTPDASVPVPQVPQVQTPSVPQVQTPSAPQVSTPSTPSVRTPSASVPSTGQSTQSTSGGGGSAGSTPGAAAPSSGSSASGGSDQGASGRNARISSARVSPQARARHRQRERRVRSEVRRLSSCLDSIDDTGRRYLSLRAGLDGPALSRGAAARELGIPRASARGVERRSLRALRNACGVSAGGGAQTVANRTASMPQFQDASLLVATGGAEPHEFVDQSELGGQGEQQVKGESKSSEPSHNEGPAEPATTEATSKPLAAASENGGISGPLLALILCLALLTAMALVALRSRRSQPAGGPPAENLTAATAVTAAPVAPAREPEPAPEPEPEPAPAAAASVPAQPETHHGRDYRRAARPAAVIASGIMSFVARELMRRRRGGGRRRR